MPQHMRKKEPTQKYSSYVALDASTSIFYTTFPADAPSYDFSPFPAASVTRHLLSSSDTVCFTAFFASEWDIPIPKANFLVFLIASPTCQSFEVTSKCLMEPHRHHFCWFFPDDCSRWVLLSLPCLWLLFETISLDYSPSHFSLQACSRRFVVLSLPACGKLSVVLHSIFDSLNCF